jgi:hypothetical protein
MILDNRLYDATDKVKKLRFRLRQLIAVEQNKQEGN